LVFVLILAVAYIFIPDEIGITELTLVRANPNGVYRYLSNGNNWSNFFDSKAKISKNIYVSDGFEMNVGKSLYEKISLTINNKNLLAISTVACLSSGFDSTIIEWRAVIKTNINPIAKIQQYVKAQQLKSTMHSLLSKIKVIIEQESNVYGLNVELTNVTLTFLATTKTTLNQYPSDSAVYSMIRNLKAYAFSKGLKDMGPPMLNVKITPDSSLATMVAVPINKEIENKDDIMFKQMLPGRILVTEINGGNETIKKAFEMMDLYMRDHQYTAPAIPFESLITDRLKERDTTKWITKIYYPIY
ncbi:MAG: GyrI-like domain-containing protein, partial [Panacibacter sp.]